MTETNDFGQPIGPDLAGWTAPGRPTGKRLVGSRVELEPLTRERHGDSLYRAFAEADGSMWTYMWSGPFADATELGTTIDFLVNNPDFVPYAVVVDGVPVGMASYLRIDPAGGVVEIGSIAFGPTLQQSTPATEAIYLMIDHVFGLGYRRCEWKCDDLNVPSRAAALRFGFRYDGTFRKATHYKGRSRDTAWYSITDDEWPAVEDRFRTWLSPENFDEQGRQRSRLGSITPGRQ